MMKQIVINIPEKEYRFFMKVLRSFPFVRIDEKKNKLLEMEASLTASNRKTWHKIKQGIKEAEAIEAGTLKGKTSKDFLNEL